MQVILRRVNADAVAPEVLLEVIRKSERVSIVHRAGINILVDCEDELPSALTSQLSGWLICPQLERAQVPNTRILISPTARRDGGCNGEPLAPVYS
jgi:hypothetical protein